MHVLGRNVCLPSLSQGSPTFSQCMVQLPVVRMCHSLFSSGSGYTAEYAAQLSTTVYEAKLQTIAQSAEEKQVLLHQRHFIPIHSNLTPLYILCSCQLIFQFGFFDTLPYFSLPLCRSLSPCDGVSSQLWASSRMSCSDVTHESTAV